MKPIDYVITTTQCVIPHIVDMGMDECLNKSMKVYMDDILYKDSYYDKGGTKSLKDFLNTENKIMVGFRGKSRILNSKRGNYRFTKDKYLQLVYVLKADYIAEYETSKLVCDGTEVVEPKDVDSLVTHLKDGAQLIGTEFVRVISENGCMMRVEGNCLILDKIFDCKCCGDLSPGYLEYIYSIKEMNAMVYIMLHNIKALKILLDGIREQAVSVNDLVLIKKSEQN